MNSEILKKYNTLLTESSFIPIPELCAVQSGRKQLAAVA